MAETRYVIKPEYTGALAALSLGLTLLRKSNWWFFTGVSKKLTKISASVQATVELLGAGQFAVYIDRHTKLPEGRGMGSSTADIIAAARATANALHETLTAEQEAQIAVTVEPSGGIMHHVLIVPGNLSEVCHPKSLGHTQLLAAGGKESIEQIFDREGGAY